MLGQVATRQYSVFTSAYNRESKPRQTHYVLEMLLSCKERLAFTERLPYE